MKTSHRTTTARSAVLLPAIVLLAGAALPGCESESEPPTAERELGRREESLMRQMDEIAAEHEPEAGDAVDGAAEGREPTPEAPESPPPPAETPPETPEGPDLAEPEAAPPA